MINCSGSTTSAFPFSSSRGRADGRSCFNFEEWVKELACLVETFVEIRSTEEEVERLMTERRRKWGVLARLMKGWGGRTRGRKGRTLAQRVAGVNEMFCASSHVRVVLEIGRAHV